MFEEVAPVDCMCVLFVLMSTCTSYAFIFVLIVLLSTCVLPMLLSLLMSTCYFPCFYFLFRVLLQQDWQSVPLFYKSNCLIKSLIFLQSVAFLNIQRTT